MEQWKHIPGYEGSYMVSSYGRVKSFKNNKERILKPGKNSSGYLNITLYKNDLPHYYRAHRLVAIAFLPNPENKNQVNHINGIKTDNRLENLEWATNKENIQHAYRTGLKDNLGEKHSNSKLTTKQVLVIRKDTRPHRVIAKDYDVTHALIGKIKRGKTWNHI